MKELSQKLSAFVDIISLQEKLVISPSCNLILSDKCLWKDLFKEDLNPRFSSQKV